MRAQLPPRPMPLSAERQLALPLVAPAGPPSPAVVGPRLAPRVVWRGLPEPARARFRATALRVLQEVLNDASPS